MKHFPLEKMREHVGKHILKEDTSSTNMLVNPIQIFVDFVAGMRGRNAWQECVAGMRGRNAWQVSSITHKKPSYKIFNNCPYLHEKKRAPLVSSQREVGCMQY